jgi:hypothetical protein
MTMKSGKNGGKKINKIIYEIRLYKGITKKYLIIKIIKGKEQII